MKTITNYLIDVLENKEDQIFEQMQAHLSDINEDDIFDIDKLDKYFYCVEKWLHITLVLNNLVSF